MKNIVKSDIWHCEINWFVQILVNYVKANMMHIIRIKMMDENFKKECIFFLG